MRPRLTGGAKRRGRAGAAGVLIALITLATLALGAGPAAGRAAAWSAGQVAGRSSPPLREYVGSLSFQVQSIVPSVVTATSGNTLTISGTMTNTSSQELSQLEFRIQRGDPLATTAAVKAELAAPSEPSAVIPQTLQSIGADLAPGASTPFTASVPVAGDSATGLAVQAPGVYPIMVNVNGYIGDPDTGITARVGELHLLTTVLAVPPVAGAAKATGTTGTRGTTGTSARSAVPLALLLPVVDRPHLGVGGVFLDDDLAPSLTGTGRLAGVLDSIDAAGQLRNAATIVLDPELLDELTRMAAGYRVVATVGQAQPALTPTTPTTPPTPATSTVNTTGRPTGSAASSGGAGASAAPIGTSSTAAGSGTAVVPAGTVPGTGQAAAIAFLARLRGAAAAHPVLLLPYADPDATALTAAGLAGELSALAAKGRALAREVLAPSPGLPAPTLLTTTAFPAGGLSDVRTLTALTRAGYRTTVLDAVSVPAAANTGAARLTQVTVAGQPMAAAVTGGGTADSIDAVIAAGTQTAAVLPLNTTAALLAVSAAGGSAAPVLVAPARQWTAGGPGWAGFLDLARAFSGADALTGTALTPVLAGAAQTASVVYPAAAAGAQLPTTYLARVNLSLRWLARLQVALKPDTSPGLHPDPVALIDSLREPMSRTVSVSQRTTPAPGESILNTVESSTTALQAGVTIRSNPYPSTLASSTSPLLVTVQNSLPYPVQIRLVITGGDRAGLKVTQPGVQLVPAGRSLQVKIEATVARSGTFTVGAQLRTLDGAAWGAATQITVNSNAYSAVTIILIVVAGGVLLLMVIFRIGQRVRARRLRIAAEAQAVALPHVPAPDSIVGSAGDEADARAGNPAGPGASTVDVSGPPDVPDPAPATVRAGGDRTPNRPDDHERGADRS